MLIWCDNHPMCGRTALVRLGASISAYEDHPLPVNRFMLDTSSISSRHNLLAWSSLSECLSIMAVILKRDAEWLHHLAQLEAFFDAYSQKRYMSHSVLVPSCTHQRILLAICALNSQILRSRIGGLWFLFTHRHLRGHWYSSSLHSATCAQLRHPDIDSAKVLRR